MLAINDNCLPLTLAFVSTRSLINTTIEEKANLLSRKVKLCNENILQEVIRHAALLSVLYTVTVFARYIIISLSYPAQATATRRTTHQSYRFVTEVTNMSMGCYRYNPLVVIILYLTTFPFDSARPSDCLYTRATSQRFEVVNGVSIERVAGVPKSVVSRRQSKFAQGGSY